MLGDMINYLIYLLILITSFGDIGMKIFFFFLGYQSQGQKLFSKKIIIHKINIIQFFTPYMYITYPNSVNVIVIRTFKYQPIKLLT